MKTHIFAGGATAIALCMTSGLAMAQEVSDTPEIMVVMDASGSMWGQIDGTSKMDIAKATLASTLEDVSAGSRLGLIAYGHRRKGDCSDIEVLVQPGAGTAGEVVAATRGLTPMGKTPLSAAVRKAAEIMKISENKATVILVTDGLETCSADPCALGRELEATGIDFTAHVIGFGLTRDEGKQVACLADETGGRYFSADTAEELGKAMEETVTAPKEEEVEEAAIESAEATVSTVASVPIGTVFEIEWTGPAGKEDYIDVMAAGDDHTTGEASYEWARDGSPAMMTAPGEPGEYNVRYVRDTPKGREVLASVPLSVLPAEFSLDGPDSAPMGSMVTVMWTAPDTDGRHYVDIHEKGSTATSGELSYAYTDSGNPVELQAPTEPGEYDLRYVMQAVDGRIIKYRQPLLVTAVEASLSYPETVAAGEYFQVTWDGPGAAHDYVDVVPVGYKDTSGELSYAYTRDGETLDIRAPEEAGRYDLRYVLEGQRGRRVILTETLVVE